MVYGRGWALALPKGANGTADSAAAGTRAVDAVAAVRGGGTQGVVIPARSAFGGRGSRERGPQSEGATTAAPLSGSRGQPVNIVSVRDVLPPTSNAHVSVTVSDPDGEPVAPVAAAAAAPWRTGSAAAAALTDAAAVRIQAASRASMARRKYRTNANREAAAADRGARMAAHDGDAPSIVTLQPAPAGPIPAAFAIPVRAVLAVARIQAAWRGTIVRRQFLFFRRAAAASVVRGVATGVGVAANGGVGALLRGADAAALSSVAGPSNRVSYVSPSGWQLFIDADDGDEFYYNVQTLASQRTVPDDYRYVSPAGWIDYVDEDGDRFFYNVRTEAVSWERPRDHV